MQIIAIMIRMAQVGEWMRAHVDDIDDETALILGASMMLIAKYGATTMSIVNNPEQPVAGRRCMFY